MWKQLNILKPDNFVAFFIIAHIISFFSLFIPYSSGAILSGLLILILLIHYRLFFKLLLEKENLLFRLFIIIEFVSFANYFIVPESREFFLNNPLIFLETISYLFVPQLAFYLFGYYAGKFPAVKARALKVIVIVTFVFGILSLVLYFTRPGFFKEFLDRTIVVEGGSDFYPRLTGYLNSMIVGILCSACLLLSFKYLKNIYFKAANFAVFVLCIILSLQRGAWASMAIGLVVFLLINFFYKPVYTFFKSTQYGLVMFFTGLVLLLGLSFLSPDLFKSDIFESINTDMVTRISTFSEAASERSEQEESFFTVIEAYPQGVGYGLLSHKSADLGFRYAIPDGNYYRIGGELGVLGLLIFLLIQGVGLFKLIYKRDTVLIIVLVLFYLQGYGTNVFDLYMCGFLFWYLLGMSYSLKENVSN